MPRKNNPHYIPQLFVNERNGSKGAVQQHLDGIIARMELKETQRDIKIDIY